MFTVIDIVHSLGIIWSLVFAAMIIEPGILFYLLIRKTKTPDFPKASAWKEAIANFLLEESERTITRLYEEWIHIRSEDFVAVFEEAVYSRRKFRLTLSNLAFCAKVGPLFGFLGTVLGIWEVFGKLYLTGGQVRIDTIANGIKLALGTTIIGLIVGSLNMLLYEVAYPRIQSYLNSLQPISEFLSRINAAERAKSLTAKVATQASEDVRCASQQASDLNIQLKHAENRLLQALKNEELANPRTRQEAWLASQTPMSIDQHALVQLVTNEFETAQMNAVSARNNVEKLTTKVQNAIAIVNQARLREERTLQEMTDANNHYVNIMGLYTNRNAEQVDQSRPLQM